MDALYDVAKAIDNLAAAVREHGKPLDDKRGWPPLDGADESRPDWLPIGTAPRDGTAILLHRNIWPGTSSGFSDECVGHNTVVGEWRLDAEGDSEKDGEWICYMNMVKEPRCPFEPTHWMPLPKPPKVIT